MKPAEQTPAAFDRGRVPRRRRAQQAVGPLGPDDEIGTLNNVTPAHVAAATALARTGKSFSLAMDFNRDGPQRARPGSKRFNPVHTMIRSGVDCCNPTNPTPSNSADDIITMPLQSATQWDALSHCFYYDKMWNGNDARLVSGALAKQGLDIPELSPAVQARIAAEIPAYGATSNPIDITAVGVQQRKHSACLDILEASDEVDILFIVSSYAPENRISLEIDDLRAMMQRRNKPVIPYTFTRPSRFCADQIASAGAYPNIHLNWAAKAAAALVEAGRFVPPAEATPNFRAYAEIAAALPPAGALGEYDAKVLLEKAGIGKPTQRLVKARGDLAKAAGELGYPLAMKIQSPDILHKTEVGGVALNLKDEAGMSAAYGAMLASVGRKAPKARIDGVLLQPMAPAGVEILIGTLNDPTFGPIVSVGMGGVTAELFKDVAYRHAPIDAAGAKAMLAELTIHPLLEGYRGAAPTDIDALAQIVAQVSQLASAFKDTVREIELNPVLVHPKGEGCTIVDALILTGPAEAQP